MDYNGMQQQQLQQHDQQQQQQELGVQNGGYQAGYPSIPSMEAPSPQAYSPEQNGGIGPFLEPVRIFKPKLFQAGEEVVAVVRDTQISRTFSTRYSG